MEDRDYRILVFARNNTTVGLKRDERERTSLRIPGTTFAVNRIGTVQREPGNRKSTALRSAGVETRKLSLQTRSCCASKHRTGERSTLTKRFTKPIAASYMYSLQYRICLFIPTTTVLHLIVSNVSRLFSSF